MCKTLTREGQQGPREVQVTGLWAGKAKNQSPIPTTNQHVNSVQQWLSVGWGAPGPSISGSLDNLVSSKIQLSKYSSALGWICWLIKILMKCFKFIFLRYRGIPTIFVFQQNLPASPTMPHTNTFENVEYKEQSRDWPHFLKNVKSLCLNKDDSWNLSLDILAL